MMALIVLAHPVAVGPSWLAWLLAVLCLLSFGLIYRMEWRATPTQRMAGAVLYAVVTICVFTIYISCGTSCNCDWSNLWCAI